MSLPKHSVLPATSLASTNVPARTNTAARISAKHPAQAMSGLRIAARVSVMHLRLSHFFSIPPATSWTSTNVPARINFVARTSAKHPAQIISGLMVVVIVRALRML